jgi:adenine-specific DNA-methyltransferase
MSPGPEKKNKSEKKVTRYTHDEVKESRTPETGHTALLPADEQVVTLVMDNGWGNAIEVGTLPEGDKRPIVVDMDPAADPVLLWSGKRNRREVPVLPLQRNEIVTDSRIAHIIERARKAAADKEPQTKQGALFADVEKILRETDRSKRVEFYTHEEGWKNRLICGDSLHVMESLLHYENLRGKVQMVYMDPPYGIKYDSNFQQRLDSTKNDEKDAADDVLTIKAFRDTWQLGVHSYLSYLEERLYLIRELLADTGSVFVQISDENLHRVRILLDEVFGGANYIAVINYTKTSSQTAKHLAIVTDYVIWYAKSIDHVHTRPVYVPKELGGTGTDMYQYVRLSDGSDRHMTLEEQAGLAPLPSGARVFRFGDVTSQRQGRASGEGSAMWFPVLLNGREFYPPEGRGWSTTKDGMRRLEELGRLAAQGERLAYRRYLDDFPAQELGNNWTDTAGGGGEYVVQTNAKVVERCLHLTTNPGDLVLDPTCGSGTTAISAEKLGRRWITCDTSRIALNVARKRLLSSVFQHYKTRNGKVSGNFQYRSFRKVTLKSLAYDLEPEKVELVHDPEVDRDAIRVCGPFEIASLGRYSVEDWKGYVVGEPGFADAAKLENYIEVICRLYRKNAAIQGASGLVHAVAESEKESIAISVGPLSGRVTAKQINDAMQDALASGILEVHVLGWAFEANVGEVKSQLEARGKVKVVLTMIRPDTLSDGLKATQPEMLFSPLALPDIDVKVQKTGQSSAEAIVTLTGVALFDREHRRTEYKHADSGYVSAWYLDEDYDGDCFVDCQTFFDFKKIPNLKAALRTEVEPAEYKLKLASQSFTVRGYRRIAVKVVDVYGNESTIVRELA